jgi:predicted ATPase
MDTAPFAGINSISVKGFRRLVEVSDLQLRPLTVLIGANQSGKSTLLNAIQLLEGAASGTLADIVEQLGGLLSMCSRGIDPPSFTLEAVIQPRFKAMPTLPTSMVEQLYYGMELRLAAPSWFRIVSESIDLLIGEKLINLVKTQYGKVVQFSSQLEDDPQLTETKSLLSFIERHAKATTINFVVEDLRSIHAYRGQHYSTKPLSAVRVAQNLRPIDSPGTLGETLFSFLYQIRETDRIRFDIMEDTLRAAFPSYRRLDFPTVSAGAVAMTWTDADYPQPFYSHELSDGVLRFLWLTAILLNPKPHAVTLIDEPEISLHPELMNFLAGLIRDASTRGQLIVATQSPALVRSLDPSEILVCDLLDGASVFRWGDSFELDEWLQEYSLDQLWSRGHIGGGS